MIDLKSIRQAIVRRIGQMIDRALRTSTNPKNDAAKQHNPASRARTMPVTVSLLRWDGETLEIEVRIHKDTPAAQLFAAALWEAYAHPETLAFGKAVSVEHVAIRSQRG